MKQFEYRKDFCSLVCDEMILLKELGKEGWELVKIYCPSYCYIMYFKREKGQVQSSGEENDI